jgi:hypothetical protein
MHSPRKVGDRVDEEKLLVRLAWDSGVLVAATSDVRNSSVLQRVIRVREHVSM